MEGVLGFIGIAGPALGDPRLNLQRFRVLPGELVGYHTYGLGDKAHRLPVSEVINNYQRSEVIDPLTVKFYFNKPSPGFLQGTATIGSGLVSLSTILPSAGRSLRCAGSY